MPLFGAMADQSTIMAAGDSNIIPSQHAAAAAAAAVGMHAGYPSVNDVSSMMMMSDVYHGNPSAMDQSVKHMLHMVTEAFMVD